MHTNPVNSPLDTSLQSVFDNACEGQFLKYQLRYLLSSHYVCKYYAYVLCALTNSSQHLWDVQFIPILQIKKTDAKGS